MALFCAATKIVVGGGFMTCFWSDRWLEGRAPRDIAPSLFTVARRKRHSVHVALQENCWIRSLRPLTTTAHIIGFVSHWTSLQEVHLDHSTPDSISWTASASGIYSTESAYKLQFQGTTSPFTAKKLWEAPV